MSATERSAERPALAWGWPGQVLFVLGLVAFEIVGTFGAGRGQPDREAVAR